MSEKANSICRGVVNPRFGDDSELDFLTHLLWIAGF